VSGWFFMLGYALSPNELGQLRDYVRGLGIAGEVAVEQVSSFSHARAVITNPEWDRRYWDAEQAEKQRLSAAASALRGTPELVQLQSRTLELNSEVVHGAAAVAAARFGCSDVGLIGAAAGAASEALHLAELAELAGEHLPHPFLLKRAVFEAGHWPLGAVDTRYYVF
jgi:hypothetical protein